MIYDSRSNLPARTGKSHARLDIGKNVFTPILGESTRGARPDIFGVYLDYASHVVEFYDPHRPITEDRMRRREAYICNGHRELRGGDGCIYCAAIYF